MSALHPLRARRYLDGRNTKLAGFIEHKLHGLDYPEALAFYRAIEPTLRPIDQALLACNDRFYLLVGILNRVDMKHPWLYDRLREVEAEPDGHLDLWARAHGKSSSITFAGTIQEILCDPEITIAIFSFNLKSARKFLGQIQLEFERNEKLYALFPDVCWRAPKREAPRWSLDKGLVFRRRGNPKEATIEGHGLIDGMPTGGHWRLLIYDDIVTEKSVTSPDMVRKATEQWELSDNLGIGDGTRKQMIGTRYSYADSYATVLQRGVKPRIYAATANGKLDGDPVFLSLARWEEIKKIQRSTVAAQMLQNPLAGSENTFLPDWFKPWEVRPSILNVYIMVDPQKGSSATSDRTAMAVVGIDAGGTKYLLDGFRHRMPLSERWEKLKALYLKWTRMPGVQLVRVGYERYGAKTDEDYIRERMRDENFSFELNILNWTKDGAQSKQDRVERLEPDFRRGRFLLPAVTMESGEEYLWRFDNAKLVTWPLGQQTINQHGVLKIISNKTSAMKRAVDEGRSYLCAKPVVSRDEDRKLYDLTLALIDEMLFFPFAPKDDLVDAVSRIYDMNPVTPSIYEDREVERLSQALEEA